MEEDIYEVEKILETKQIENNLRIYKVRWHGYGPDDDTWEPEENLLSCQNIVRAFWNQKKVASRVSKAKKRRRYKKSSEFVVDTSSASPGTSSVDYSSQEDIKPPSVRDNNRLSAEEWAEIAKAVTEASSMEGKDKKTNSTSRNSKRRRALGRITESTSLQEDLSTHMVSDSSNFATNSTMSKTSSTFVNPLGIPQTENVAENSLLTADLENSKLSTAKPLLNGGSKMLESGQIGNERKHKEMQELDKESKNDHEDEETTKEELNVALKGVKISDKKSKGFARSLSCISIDSSSSSSSDDDASKNWEAKSLLAKWGAKKYAGFNSPSKLEVRRRSLKKQKRRKQISYEEDTKKNGVEKIDEVIVASKMNTVEKVDNIFIEDSPEKRDKQESAAKAEIESPRNDNNKPKVARYNCSDVTSVANEIPIDETKRALMESGKVDDTINQSKLMDNKSSVQVTTVAEIRVRDEDLMPIKDNANSSNDIDIVESDNRNVKPSPLKLSEVYPKRDTGSVNVSSRGRDEIEPLDKMIKSRSDLELQDMIPIEASRTEFKKAAPSMKTRPEFSSLYGSPLRTLKEEGKNVSLKQEQEHSFPSTMSKEEAKRMTMNSRLGQEHRSRNSSLQGTPEQGIQRNKALDMTRRQRCSSGSNSSSKFSRLDDKKKDSVERRPDNCARGDSPSRVREQGSYIVEPKTSGSNESGTIHRSIIAAVMASHILRRERENSGTSLDNSSTSLPGHKQAVSSPPTANKCTKTSRKLQDRNPALFSHKICKTVISQPSGVSQDTKKLRPESDKPSLPQNDGPKCVDSSSDWVPAGAKKSELSSGKQPAVAAAYGIREKSNVLKDSLKAVSSSKLVSEGLQITKQSSDKQIPKPANRTDKKSNILEDAKKIPSSDLASADLHKSKQLSDQHPTATANRNNEKSEVLRDSKKVFLSSKIKSEDYQELNPILDQQPTATVSRINKNSNILVKLEDSLNSVPSFALVSEEPLQKSNPSSEKQRTPTTSKTKIKSSILKKLTEIGSRLSGGKKSFTPDDMKMDQGAEPKSSLISEDKPRATAALKQEANVSAEVKIESCDDGKSDAKMFVQSFDCIDESKEACILKGGTIESKVLPTGGVPELCTREAVDILSILDRPQKLDKVLEAQYQASRRSDNSYTGVSRDLHKQTSEHFPDSTSESLMASLTRITNDAEGLGNETNVFTERDSSSQSLKTDIKLGVSCHKDAYADKTSVTSLTPQDIIDTKKQNALAGDGATRPSKEADRTYFDSSKLSRDRTNLITDLHTSRSSSPKIGSMKTVSQKTVNENSKKVMDSRTSSEEPSQPRKGSSLQTTTIIKNPRVEPRESCKALCDKSTSITEDSISSYRNAPSLKRQNSDPRKITRNSKPKNTPAVDGGLRLEFTKVETASSDQTLKTKNGNKRVESTVPSEKRPVKKIKMDPSKLRYANRRNASKEAFASPTKDVLGDILGRSAMLSLIDQPANKHEKEPKKPEKEEVQREITSTSVSESEFDLEEFNGEDELFGGDEEFMDPISDEEIPPLAMTREECLQAFCTGDYEKMLSGIAGGLDPDFVQSTRGRTPLLYAIIRDEFHLAKTLLRLGANPNALLENGKSVLMVAVEMGKFAFVQMLLRAGAHINLQEDNGETALILACRMGHVDIINLLLSHGADVKVTPAPTPKPVAEYSPEFQILLIKRTIDRYNEKLKVASESVLRQCINPTDEIVQPPVLACRCISPEEKKFHDFYFKCEHNADEKGTAMLLICACVQFTSSGEIKLLLDKRGNGIEAVMLNNEHQIPVFERNHSMFFLFPNVGQMNSLCLRTQKSGFKLLVAIYAIKSYKPWMDERLEPFVRDFQPTK